jgi:hypothetical protein
MQELVARAAAHLAMLLTTQPLDVQMRLLQQGMVDADGNECVQ